MSSLSAYVDIITTDGRCLVGNLKGYDQTTNLILSDCQERIITPDEPTEIMDLGLYIVRGLSVALIGEVDDQVAKDIDWSKVRRNIEESAL